MTDNKNCKCKPGEAIEVDNMDVTSPPYYLVGDLEVKDILRAKLTTEEFKGFLKGNILKYIFRCEFKNNTLKDLQKAREYLDMLIKEVS